MENPIVDSNFQDQDANSKSVGPKSKSKIVNEEAEVPIPTSSRSVRQFSDTKDIYSCLTGSEEAFEKQIIPVKDRDCEQATSTQDKKNMVFMPGQASKEEIVNHSSDTPSPEPAPNSCTETPGVILPFLPRSFSPDSGSGSPPGSPDRKSLSDHLQLKQKYTGLGPTPSIDPLDPEGVEGSVVDQDEQAESDSITNPMSLAKDYLRVSVDHLSQRITLHYDKANAETPHFFELIQLPGTDVSRRLLGSIARDNGVESFPIGPNTLKAIKRCRLYINFQHCTYQVAQIIKQSYTLVFNSAFEQSLFYYPTIIFDQKLGYIRTFPKTSKKTDFSFSCQILNQKVKRAVDQAVECRGQVIFTGQSASLLRAASLLTASHLQPSNGIILILCNYLVTPFWRLVIQKMLKEVSSIQLHCISIKDKKRGKLDSVVQEKFLTESIILVSLTKFEDFVMPKTNNKITLILDDVLKKPSECDPQDLFQMQKAERIIVVDPNYKKMRRRERDLILTGLIRHDLALNSPFLRMIERLHMIDLDEDSFDPALEKQYNLQIGVYSVRLDPQKAAEMEAIQEVLDKDDRGKCLDMYIGFFGAHSLESLANKLTLHFEQASEIIPPAVKQSKKFKKQNFYPPGGLETFLDDEFDSPVKVDPLSMGVFGHPDDKQAYIDSDDDQKDELDKVADKIVPENAHESAVDCLTMLGKRSMVELLQQRVSPLATEKNSETKMPDSTQNASETKSSQDMEGMGTTNDENMITNFTARLSRRKRKRAKQKRSRAMVEQAARMPPETRPRKYQVSNMKEYIANHQFECARKGLHFRMLNLNSEGKIEATLKIIQYHIKISQSKRVIIWCHHQYIQSIAYKNLEKTLPGDFSLFCNFTKSKDKRDLTIQKFREASGKAVIILSMLSHKELMIGTQWDLMVFAELIHQRHHLEEAVKLGFLQQHFSMSAEQQSAAPGKGNFYPNQEVNRTRQIIFVKSGSGINIDTGMWDKVQELMVNLHTPTKPCKGPDSNVEFEGSTLSEWSNPAYQPGNNRDEVMSLAHTNTTFQEEDLTMGRGCKPFPDVEIKVEDMDLEEVHKIELIESGVESFRLIREDWLPSYSADSQLFGIPISRTETIKRAKADRNSTPLESVHSLNWTPKYKALFEAHKKRLAAASQENSSSGSTFAQKFSDASFGNFNQLMEDSEYKRVLENPFASASQSQLNSSRNSMKKVDLQSSSRASSSSFRTEARRRTRSQKLLPLPSDSGVHFARNPHSHAEVAPSEEHDSEDDGAVGEQSDTESDEDKESAKTDHFAVRLPYQMPLRGQKRPVAGKGRDN